MTINETEARHGNIQNLLFRAPKYQISYSNGAIGFASDTAICLVDLDADNAANWSHPSTGNVVVIRELVIKVVPGSFTGQVYAGFVQENDATDGSLVLAAPDILQLTNDELVIKEFICSTDYQKKSVSGNYTVLATGATYGESLGGSHSPEVGDFVIIVDTDSVNTVGVHAYGSYSII